VIFLNCFENTAKGFGWLIHLNVESCRVTELKDLNTRRARTVPVLLVSGYVNPSPALEYLASHYDLATQYVIEAIGIVAVSDQQIVRLEPHIHEAKSTLA